MAETSAGQKGRPQRPLSPHIQIHALPINMVMSIVHRLTGAALYFGTLILAWWLIAAATSAHYFNFVSGLLGTWPGKLVLIGYTWAFLHHMLGGLRHFIWDLGRGFDLKTIDQLSWGTLILSLVLTAAIWGLALTGHGGFSP
jgi:succinate dehydrogenase / fumarate reductase, cytochrome b subunit